MNNEVVLLATENFWGWFLMPIFIPWTTFGTCVRNMELTRIVICKLLGLPKVKMIIICVL